MKTSGMTVITGPWRTWLIGKKDLEDCLDILQKHPFKSPYFQLFSRVLHTQAYFDLCLQDNSYLTYLLHYFDNFEKWLNREKVWSASSRKAFLRFVQKCRTLARYYVDVDFDAQKVERLLEGESNIQALNWLERKKRQVLQLKGK